MDLFYRLARKNGYKTDGKGNLLADTGLKVSLFPSGSKAWENIHRKFIDGRDDDFSDIKSFVYKKQATTVTVKVCIGEKNNIVLVQED